MIEPVPGPGLEEYAARAASTGDLPDDTGYPYLVERSSIATRQHDVAAQAGTLTWRLVLRRDYRAAMACTNPAELAAALQRVVATATGWATAVERRRT